MKVIIYIFLYIILTMIYYFAFSLIGLLFNKSYWEIISNPNWFTVYLVTTHWWLVILSLHEYYCKYLKDIE